MEALFSGCLLLKEAGGETRKWLTPDVHYVEFETTAELEKNKLFIAHDEERKKIAAAGHEYVLTNYAMENFW